MNSAQDANGGLKADVARLSAENATLWMALTAESAEVMRLHDFLNANRKYIGSIPPAPPRGAQETR